MTKKENTSRATVDDPLSNNADARRFLRKIQEYILIYRVSDDFLL